MATHLTIFSTNQWRGTSYCGMAFIRRNIGLGLGEDEFGPVRTSRCDYGCHAWLLCDSATLPRLAGTLFPFHLVLASDNNKWILQSASLFNGKIHKHIVEASLWL